jgi:hypothetical protein
VTRSQGFLVLLLLGLDQYPSAALDLAALILILLLLLLIIVLDAISSRSAFIRFALVSTIVNLCYLIMVFW